LPEQPAPTNAACISPLVRVNLSAGKKLSSKPFCRQIEQLQLTAFVGSSASSLNVTAPQWRDAKLKPRRRLAELVLGDPTNITR
jgi:hypothetical protein